MNKKMKMLLKIAGILSVVTIILIMATSCIRFTGISGSGDVISEERKVEGFNSISVSANMFMIIFFRFLRNWKIMIAFTIIEYYH